jgi:hypothetical protein
MTFALVDTLRSHDRATGTNDMVTTPLAAS